MKTITLQIKGAQLKPIRLSKVVIPEKPLSEPISLHITIKKGCTCTIKDDLLSVGIHQCSMIITLQTDSQLFLEAYFLCPLLAGCSSQQCHHLPRHACQLITRNLRFELYGIRAKVYSKIRFAGGKSRALRIDSTQHHIAPHTESSISIKSVLDDGAHIQCDMLTKMSNTAKGSTSTQENKNLLIGNASVKATPKLEISAHKVKCQHGSATGKIDNAQLFYLQSRGLDIKTAKTMLIGAFLV